MPNHRVVGQAEGGGLEPHASRHHPFSRRGPRHSRTSPSILKYPVRVSIPVLRHEKAPSHHSTNGAFANNFKHQAEGGGHDPQTRPCGASHPVSNRGGGRPAIHLPAERPGRESNPRDAQLQCAAWPLGYPANKRADRCVKVWPAGIEPASPPWQDGVLAVERQPQ